MRFISVPRYGKWKTKSSTSGRTSRCAGCSLLDRVHDHRAVVRQRARVVGDDERAPVVGDVAEARASRRGSRSCRGSRAAARRAPRTLGSRPNSSTTSERSRMASLRQRFHMNSSGSFLRSSPRSLGARRQDAIAHRLLDVPDLVDQPVADAPAPADDRSTARTPTAAASPTTYRSPAPAAAAHAPPSHRARPSRSPAAAAFFLAFGFGRLGDCRPAAALLCLRRSRTDRHRGSACRHHAASHSCCFGRHRRPPRRGSHGSSP